jgi:hypothetical protein
MSSNIPWGSPTKCFYNLLLIFSVPLPDNFPIIFSIPSLIIMYRPKSGKNGTRPVRLVDAASRKLPVHYNGTTKYIILTSTNTKTATSST